MGELEYIARNCRDDKRLLNIVEDIAKMTQEEKDEFANKMRSYFMNKNTEEDRSAYRFFKVVLENDNARKILEMLGDI
ncbi:hypothetical protein XJ44_05900 [Thermosipho affectus]|uniref:Uncharacterized protein n=1 Tax=Thermosipho affectus TaxID=660294 RepID=A0ABX3IHJ7_9BACT|nr:MULTISPECIES: hypothetical protein [Thermosipho]ANQ53959.1 hypothetical protein Y592_06015 [Thermosipho sp. 1070]APT72404.1 hypothetical protein BG95_05940 [Thermosipho sp. 1063]ONN27306.1 hypothetical protein XJ44_05900 [Thermosipho affectus]OOC43645.1 hypothetical protein XO08_05805 [Thermosipho sp. 1074]